MATTSATPIDISEVCEVNSGKTYSSITTPIADGSYEAKIEDLLEPLEDEEDIREGLKALEEGDEGSVTLEELELRRAESRTRA